MTHARARDGSVFDHQRDGEAPTGSLRQLQHVALLHHALGDGVSLGVGLVVGILGVGIDGAVVLAALVQEVKFDDRLVAVLVSLAANNPVVGTLGLAGYGDVVGRLSLQVDALVPVAGHVADELEGVVPPLVVLGQVGSHL